MKRDLTTRLIYASIDAIDYSLSTEDRHWVVSAILEMNGAWDASALYSKSAKELFDIYHNEMWEEHQGEVGS